MLCVNTNSKEFKQLSAELDIQPSQLELIIHEFINQYGDANIYPTKEYILRKLQGTSGVFDNEILDNALTVWYEKYSAPIHISNYDELVALKEKLNILFGEKSYGVRNKLDGTYEVNVAKPTSDRTKEIELEIQQIKKQAIKDGTFMKAPNGKPTNLTERQWLQVRTKEFKEWFGDWEKLFYVYLGKNTTDDGRKYNYYTIYPNEAKKYGFNVEGKLINTTGFLSYFSPLFEKLKQEFFYNTKKRFDILNNSEEGIKTQTEFFDFLKSKGYKGLEYLSEHPYLYREDIENPYIVTFDDLEKNNLTSNVSKDKVNDLYSNVDLINKDLVDVEYHDKSWKDNPSKSNKTIRLYLKDHNKGYFELVKDHEFGMYSVHFKISKEGAKFNGEATFSTKEDRRILFTELIKLIPDGALVSTWGDVSADGIKGIENIGRNMIKVGTREVVSKETGKKTLVPIYQKENGVSKVVDENGEPLVVYHGSSKNINIFEANYKPIDGGFYGLGSYFTNNKDYAENYGNKIHEVFLNIKNPKEISAEDESMLEKEITENDGVIADFSQVSDDVDWKEFVVPKSNQVKSATGNNGEFSRENDSIYHEGEYYNYLSGKQDAFLRKYEGTGPQPILIFLNKVYNSKFSGIMELLREPKLSVKEYLKDVTVRVINPLDYIHGYEATDFGRRRAYYSAREKTIYINSDATYDDGDSSSVLFHEILHALTVDRILNNKKSREEFDKIIDEYLENSFNEPRYDKRRNDHYMEEFIADIWSNNYLIERLKQIKTKDKNTLWDKIKHYFNNLFNQMFGYVDDKSLFAKASGELYNLLETPVDESRHQTDRFYEGELLIKYNEEQQKAISEVLDWVNNPKADKRKSWYVIEGKAGVGKTTIAREILRLIIASQKDLYGFSIGVGTISHKAKEVIDNGLKVDKDIQYFYKASTIASMLGLKYDEQTGEFKLEYDNYGNPKPGKIRRYDVILIDEASMVNKKAVEQIMEKKNPNTPVIFLGDRGQLPPVETKNPELQDLDSKAFNTQNKSKLYTRVRQGEQSPILPYADYYWNNSQSENPVLTPTPNEVKNIITPEGNLVFLNSINKAIDKILPAFRKAVEEKNPSHVKLIVFRNESVDSYNNKIHNLLFPNSDESGFNDGEMLMTYSTHGKQEDNDFIPNSYDIVLNRILTRSADENGIRYIIGELKVGNKIMDLPIVYKSDRIKYKKIISDLWAEIIPMPKSPKKQALINKVLEYTERYLNADLGYAINTHKSQGSTYDISIVDEDEIKSVGPISNKFKSQSIYVGITRARNTVVIVSDRANEPLTEDIETLTENTELLKNKECIKRIEQAVIKGEDINQTSQSPAQKTEESKPNLSDFEFYSGAAQGSDTEWANQAKSTQLQKTGEISTEVKLDKIEIEKTGILSTESWNKVEQVANQINSAYSEKTMDISNDDITVHIEQNNKGTENYSINVRKGIINVGAFSKIEETSNPIHNGIITSDTIKENSDGSISAQGSLVAGPRSIFIAPIIITIKGKGVTEYLQAVENVKKVSREFDNLMGDGAKGKDEYLRGVQSIVSIKLAYLNMQIQNLINSQSFTKNNLSISAEVKKDKAQLDSIIGIDNEAKSEVSDVIKVAQRGISFEEALANQEAIFTKEEQEQIKSALNGKNLQVLSVSRYTDPAFFSKEIIAFLEKNSHKAFNDPTRINAVEIWSKHDGEPIQDILEACKKYKVAPMMSFSITGLGGTVLEGGVMKYNDLLDRIEQLIKVGSLNPVTTTVRLDPILVGVTNMEDIKKIVERSKALGIKKFVTSLVQSYGYLDGTARDRKVTSGINNALASEGKTYDWDKYYGRDRRGKINFKPKQQYIDEVGKVLIELDSDPTITIQTCSFGIKGLKVSACLDPFIIERITGVNVLRKDGTYDRDTSRPECMCYGAHSDIFKFTEKKCFSCCAYCYAAHSGDNKLNYYNEDGSIKDTPYTRVNQISTTSSIVYQNINSQNQTQQEVTISFEENIQTQEEEEQQKLQNQTEALIAEKRELSEIEKQTNNLYNNNILTSTEIAEIAIDMAYFISKEINDCFNDKNLVFEHFTSKRTLEEDGTYPEENKQTDLKKVSKMSKKQLINFIGGDALMEYCDLTLFTSLGNKFVAEDDDAYDVAEQCHNNFKALMSMANDTLMRLDNISFNTVFNKQTKEIEVVIKNATELSEDAIGEQDNEKKFDEIKEIGNQQEHWQVLYNTLSVIQTMGQKVKQTINECYRLDENGDYILNKLGRRKRVELRQAVQTILDVTRDCLDLPSMVNALQNSVNKYPWLQLVLDKLADKNDYTFQSQFFSTFFKPFCNYSIIILDKKTKTYKAVSLNENPASKLILKDVETAFKISNHTLFTSKGIDVEQYKVLQEQKSAIDKMFTDFFDREDRDIDTLTDEKKESLINKSIELVMNTLNTLGIDISKDIIELVYTLDNVQKQLASFRSTLASIMDNLSKKLNDVNYNPFAYGKEANGIKGYLSNLIKPFTDLLDYTMTNSFFEGGNMYQSNVLPSFLSKLMIKFHLDDNAFLDFLENEYGISELFVNKQMARDNEGHIKPEAWRIPWLLALASMDLQQRKQLFRHKVQLSFDKSYYMRDMSDIEYGLSILSEYFGTESTNSATQVDYAYYRMMIMSNKPSSEFIKFLKYTNTTLYKSILLKKMNFIFQLELDLIQTVTMRNVDSKSPLAIKNFDINGKQFNYFTFLNEYLKNKQKTIDLFDPTDGGTVKVKFGELLSRRINGDKLSVSDELKIIQCFNEVAEEFFDTRAEQIINSWKLNGIYDAAKKHLFPKDGDSIVEEKLINFVWNDAFASMNLMQLTISTPAFYSNAEDLQKRLAQLHAPGVRGNYLVEYKGERIADEYQRSIKLTDFDTFISNVIDNIDFVFKKKIKAAKTELEKQALIVLKDSLVGEKGVFREINVADAQAFSSPTSYRKKALIFGKWSEEAEAIYQRILHKKASVKDLQVAFLPLKPFVYSKENVDISLNGQLPVNTIPVPVQYKNAEYLLMMADALIGNETEGKPNILRAIYLVMEESSHIYKETTDEKTGKVTKELVGYRRDGIDTVQFESAVKSGLRGKLNLNVFLEESKDNEFSNETKAKVYLERCIYKDLDNHIYNDDYIDKVRWEDYCLQQDIPEHFKEHYQMLGSQYVSIIPSGLDSFDADGNIIKYEFTDNGLNVSLTAKEVKTEFSKLLSENIEESIQQLAEEICLDTPNHIYTRREKNEAVSKILLKEINSSPRYGMELRWACMLDENGEFNIPKGDPIQAKRIEQLLNSIIKNRINKQEIAGGPIVLVSNFGMSKELNIVFKSKNPNETYLKSRKQWEESYTESDKYKTYEEYVEENQAGIAYYECFAPIYSNELLKFTDNYGNIDVKKIEEFNPELLKLIGYRIPTEDKYSIAPIKIVGFVPREAGDAIILPNDITVLTGCDFDVDKFYIIRKDIGFESENDYPTEGKKYRNNKLFDISWSVLTHAANADKILNPGGFESQKRMGYMVSALKTGNYTLEQLQQMKTSDLKKACYKDKNLMFIDTQLDFYKQNAAAGTILGMFAVLKVAHAILEDDHFGINISKMSKPFSIAGKTFKDIMEFDIMYDDNNQYIGKTLGSLIASAADAVKDPVLNLMNINNNTANVLTTLIRLGMPFDKAALFLSQNVISELLQQVSLSAITNSGLSLRSVLQSLIVEYGKKLDFYDKNGNIVVEMNDVRFQKESEPLTEEQLWSMLNPKETLNINEQTLNGIKYKTLINFERILDISQELKVLTYATRFNSITNAVGPLIIDNIVMENKMLQSSSVLTQREYSYRIISNNKTHKFGDIIEINGREVKLNEETILDLINNKKIEVIVETSNIDKDDSATHITCQNVFAKHPHLAKYAETVNIARKLFADMPTNFNSFRTILNLYRDSSLNNTLLNDRKLLGELINIYESYMLVASGAITQEQLLKTHHYIKDYPKLFIDKDYKHIYSDNRLILAIHTDTVTDNKGVEIPILTLNVTGLELNEKDLLVQSWIDLYKQNETLAMDLFYYNFFRGGIEFSPKTFINLLPNYIKTKIARYNETFKHDFLSTFQSEQVLQIYVLHNVKNNRLVPNLSKQQLATVKDKLDIYSSDNKFLVDTNTLREILQPYIKIDFSKLTNSFEQDIRLFKLVQHGVDDMGAAINYYEEIPILGNNGTFIDLTFVKPSDQSYTNMLNLSEKMSDDTMNEQTYTDSALEFLKQKLIEIASQNKALKSLTTEQMLEAVKQTLAAKDDISEKDVNTVDEQSKKKAGEICG